MDAKPANVSLVVLHQGCFPILTAHQKIDPSLRDISKVVKDAIAHMSDTDYALSDCLFILKIE